MAEAGREADFLEAPELARARRERTAASAVIVGVLVDRKDLTGETRILGSDQPVIAIGEKDIADARIAEPAPAILFGRALSEGKAVRPFAAEIERGGYWLTRLKSRKPGRAMAAFESWIVAAAGRPQ